MSADPALALAVAYLRLNGYFLLTEQELHIRESAGYRTLTDIDIIALRPPTASGPAHHHLGQGVEECLIVTDVDPGLDVDTSRFDVIVGEVKTAEAELNPALRTPVPPGPYTPPSAAPATCTPHPSTRSPTNCSPTGQRPRQLPGFGSSSSPDTGMWRL